jgi:hypothetical protein
MPHSLNRLSIFPPPAAEVNDRRLVIERQRDNGGPAVDSKLGAIP